MKKSIWALYDNRMGSAGQIKGVIQALGEKKYKTTEKKIGYNIFAKLPNFFKGSSLLGIVKESKKALRAPWPDLVISASRRTAPIARWIKKRSKGKTKIIQLIHPGNSGINDFDLVFVPEHDRHKKTNKNFVYTIGSPHRVTEKALAEAKAMWEEEFKDLPRPLTAVIAGGSIKGKEFPLENVIHLSHAIRKFKDKTGGSILFTNSHRTGPDANKILLELVKKYPHYNYLWGGTGVNPIMGFWACADQIIVTGDSVSMCSESCGSGKPVFIFTDTWLTSKHLRFVQSLYDGGYAYPLSGENTESFQPAGRLNSSNVIAQKIDELF